MGDITYPAIQIWKGRKNVQEVEVIEDILKHVGRDRKLYSDGAPVVTIYREENAPSTNIIVSGIRLSYNDIRRKLAKKFVGGVIATIKDPDFEVPRLNNGLISRKYIQINEKLLQGQGMLPPINLVLGDFCIAQLGGMKHPAQILTVDYNLARTSKQMMSLAGEFLSFRKISKNSTRHEIHYVTRFDALQSILYLNKNKSFANPPTSFIVEENRYCQYQGNDYLGRSGVIKVQDLMKIHRFIPVGVVRPDVIPEELAQLYATKCLMCTLPYDIKGFGPDFNWFAATCGLCDEEKLLGHWGDESFIRLTLNPELRKQTSTYGISNVKTCRRQALIPFIQGITPLFEDVKTFKNSAVAAAISEHRFSKRDVGSNQQFGITTSVELHEILPKTEQRPETNVYRTTFRTLKSAVWCTENIGGIKSLTVIPTLSDADDMNLAREISDEDFTLPHSWFRGVVYDITNLTHQHVVVTALINTPSVREFFAGEFILVPKVPILEVAGLRRLTNKWQLFEQTRSAQMMVGEVITAKLCRGVRNLPHDCNFFYVGIILDKHADLKCFDEQESKRYFGAEMYIAVTRKLFPSQESDTIKTTGRVLSIVEQNGTNKVKIATFIHRRWKINLSHTVPSLIHLRFWTLTDKCIVLSNKTNAIAAGAEFDLASEDEYDLGQESESDEDEEGKLVPVVQTAIPTVPVFPCEKLVLPYSGPEDIVKNWKEKDETDFSWLDFLLRKKAPYILHPYLLGLLPKKTPHQETVAAINAALNQPQRDEVYKLLHSPLSATIGPPGTGKTTVAVYGILRLLLQEDGVILSVCPSNFAAHLLYSKLRNVSDRLHMNTRITYMLSESKEHLDMKNKAELYTKDSNLLHVRMRSSLKWRKADTADIVNRYERYGMVDLKKEERDTLQRHRGFLAAMNLLEADVVVSTVGAACDGRLANLSKRLKETGRTISALVIDESSLLTVPGILPILTLAPSRVWLLGDASQLSPTVKCESAVLSGLDISWMELLEITPYAQKHGIYGMLKIQYRMSAEISYVVSNLMYSGEVVSDESVLARCYENMPEFDMLREEFPELAHHNIGLYSYNGWGDRAKGISTCNDKEMAITQNLLQKLLKCKISMSDVVVIAMYEAQVYELKKMVGGMGPQFQNVEIASTDSWQGKESPIVILNTVRSNPQHKVGFLRYTRRMNVAISRAIHYLLLVTDTKTLPKSGIPDLARLFQMISDMGIQQVNM